MYDHDLRSRDFRDDAEYQALFPNRCRPKAEPSDEMEQPDDNDNE